MAVGRFAISVVPAYSGKWIVRRLLKNQLRTRNLVP